MDWIDLLKAEELASERHQGQLYKGSDYFEYHIQGVAAQTSNLFGVNPLMQMVAILHDIVEDTDTTLDEIGELFGDRVRELVDNLTKRPKEPYYDYIVRVTSDQISTKIKIADNLFNLKHSVEEFNLRRIIKYSDSLEYLTLKLDRMET